MALKQDPENQLLDLRRWAKAVGHEVEGEYVDTISSKDTRPQKELVLRKLRLGEVKGVAFWSLDRWGRTMSELVLELEEFGQSGVSLFSMKEGLDLSSAAGRMMTHVLAAMANFERDRIQERTLLGLARARAQGKRLGRHPWDCRCEKHRERAERIYGLVKETPLRTLRQFQRMSCVIRKTVVFLTLFSTLMFLALLGVGVLSESCAW